MATDTAEARASVFLTNLTGQSKKQSSSSSSSSSSAGANQLEVLPGDDVTEHLKQRNDSRHAVQLGRGLARGENGRVLATAAGTLTFRAPGSFWVESFSRLTHYYPKTGDQVVGIIEDRGGDWYKVNIGSGASALLSRLAFEGASKRNKPELERGDVAYMRVLSAHADMDVELTCISASGLKKDWSSGECLYGPLKEGLVLQVSQQLCRKLLRPDNALLNALGKHVPFEVAVGMNGQVWLRAGNIIDTIILRNALSHAEGLDDVHSEALALQLVKRARTLQKH